MYDALKMKALLAMLAAGLLLCGPGLQSQDQTKAEARDVHAYSYSYFHLHYVYPGQYSSFGDVDSRNFTIHTFDGKGRHLACGHLHAGEWYSDTHPAGKEWLTLKGAFPLPARQEKESFMLVLVEEESITISSDSFGVAQVWKLREGKLEIIQQIDFDTHFEFNGRYAEFSRARNRLTVRAAHYLDFDARCCVSAYDELTFEWTGTDFQLKRKTTHLSENGKREGKTLQP